MELLLLPSLVFLVVFGGVLLASRRAPRAVLRLDRHQIVGAGGSAVAVPRPPTSLLGIGPRAGSATALATRVARQKVRTKAGKLLLEAGSPMALGTYLLLRAVFTFVVAPLFVLYILATMGTSFFGLFIVGIGALTIPHLPLLRIKRKARFRAGAIERAMPDALDLLVVCVEGGLSLDAALLQVAQRTHSVLAAELRRLQSDVGAGMARRDAFQALAARSQSESLAIFCSTMVQADKMGMSVAMTLRTLAETMRTRRRQRAETQARKAPIKMMPCLVFFMIPSLFVVILGPAVLSIIKFMQDVSSLT